MEKSSFLKTKNEIISDFFDFYKKYPGRERPAGMIFHKYRCYSKTQPSVASSQNISLSVSSSQMRRTSFMFQITSISANSALVTQKTRPSSEDFSVPVKSVVQ